MSEPPVTYAVNVNDKLIPAHSGEIYAAIDGLERMVADLDGDYAILTVKLSDAYHCLGNVVKMIDGVPEPLDDPLLQLERLAGLLQEVRAEAMRIVEVLDDHANGNLSEK